MHADGGSHIEEQVNLWDFLGKKIQENFKENLICIYFEIMFYLYILVHALFSFYVIIYVCDYSVLENYINVTVNSNSVRNYCSYKKMK